MFLFAGALLINKEGMKKLYQDETNIMIGGVISLLIGLPVIILHNIWTTDVLGVITYIGWMSTLKGVVRIAFPSFVVNKMKKSTVNSLKIWLIFAMLLGAGLIYCGYYPYW